MTHLLMSSGYRNGELIVTEGMIGSKLDDIAKRALSIFHSTTKEEAEREGKVQRRVLQHDTKEKSALLRKHNINPDSIKTIVKRRVKKAHRDLKRSVNSRDTKSMSKIMMNVVRDIENEINENVIDTTNKSLPNVISIVLLGFVFTLVAIGLISALLSSIAPGLAAGTIAIIAAAIVHPNVKTYIRWLKSKINVIGSYIFSSPISTFLKKLILLPFAPIASIIKGLSIAAHYIKDSLVKITTKKDNPLMLIWGYIMSLLFGVA